VDFLLGAGELVQEAVKVPQSEDIGYWESFYHAAMVWLGRFGLSVWPLGVVLYGTSGMRAVAGIWNWDKLLEKWALVLSKSAPNVIKNIFWMIMSSLLSLSVCALFGLKGIMEYQFTGFRGTLVAAVAYFVASVAIYEWADRKGFAHKLWLKAKPIP